jgi:hypothetical protein
VAEWGTPQNGQAPGVMLPVPCPVPEVSFETNVLSNLELTQKIIDKFVEGGHWPDG